MPLNHSLSWFLDAAQKAMVIELQEKLAEESIVVDPLTGDLYAMEETPSKVAPKE